MFTLTTELAFRALLVLVHGVELQPASPRKISAHLQCSPTYLSKTLGLLVKASHRLRSSATSGPKPAPAAPYQIRARSSGERYIGVPGLMPKAS